MATGGALAKYHLDHKSFDKSKAITARYCGAIERLSERLSAMYATAHLSDVEKAYRSCGLREDAKRVRVILERRGRDANAEMTEHTVEITHNREEVERSIAQMLDHSDPCFALSQLAWGYAPRPEDVIESFRNASEVAPFLLHMPISLIGSDGLPVASIGSYDNDADGHHNWRYMQEMTMSVGFFAIGFDAWRDKFECTDFKNVQGLFSCFLIPESRRSLFEDGFAAYANGDYVKAIHVLIPQVENTLRELLKFLDIPTTKNDADGGFELKNMNDVLHDETVRNTLDERLWTFLKVLYTDKRGFNLRNKVMHGMAETSELNQSNAALVLQSIMLLTMIREGAVFRERRADTSGGTQDTERSVETGSERLATDP